MLRARLVIKRGRRENSENQKKYTKVVKIDPKVPLFVNELSKYPGLLSFCYNIEARRHTMEERLQVGSDGRLGRLCYTNTYMS